MSRAPLSIPTLAELLPIAESCGFAIGSFAPRYPAMIRPILEAAEACESPAIVQISQKDISRCEVDLAEFAEMFFDLLGREFPHVSAALHLDHTEDVSIIHQAIEVGFSSVMIDASDRPFEENVAVTGEIVEHAREHGVSVEGELGTIGAAGFSETDESHLVHLTNPEEAGVFVARTGIDALAISVGTIHGLDPHRQVTVDIERIRAIRRRTSAHLVLHGGSGVPAEAMAQAIDIRGGGVSKVNLATDLEVAMLAALDRSQRMKNQDVEALAWQELRQAQQAVRGVVVDKIRNYLKSAGRRLIVMTQLAAL